MPESAPARTPLPEPVEERPRTGPELKKPEKPVQASDLSVQALSVSPVALGGGFSPYLTFGYTRAVTRVEWSACPLSGAGECKQGQSTGTEIYVGRLAAGAYELRVKACNETLCGAPVLKSWQQNPWPLTADEELRTELDEKLKQAFALQEELRALQRTATCSKSEVERQVKLLQEQLINLGPEQRSFKAPAEGPLAQNTATVGASETVMTGPDGLSLAACETLLKISALREEVAALKDRIFTLKAKLKL